MDVDTMPAKKREFLIILLKIDCRMEGKSNLGMIVIELTI